MPQSLTVSAPEAEHRRPEEMQEERTRSPASRLRLAGSEEFEQRLDVVAVGAHGHLVDCQPPKQVTALITLARYALRVLVSHNRRARVNLDVFARFRIDKPGKADVRQLALAWIFPRDSHDVVSLGDEFDLSDLDCRYDA